jgi:hypothetical protein
LIELQSSLASDGCANPFEAARNCVYAWERLQRAVPGFPRQVLARLYQAADGREQHAKLDALPAPFQSDWLRFAKQFGEAPVAATGSLSDYVLDDDAVDEDLDDDILEDSWAMTRTICRCSATLRISMSTSAPPT